MRSRLSSVVKPKNETSTLRRLARETMTRNREREILIVARLDVRRERFGILKVANVGL